MHRDREACYRAVKSRDRRFDGVFYIAVRTTGIYCRPSCPARTPALENVTFHASAASAQAAGYRACKRCLPDATPGSPDWDVAADAAGRAMRQIADGVVEREGIEGLAAKVGYSTRQLNRLVTQEFGAGPLALARSRRAQTARVLIETTAMPFGDIAFAAGFASIRQFNDTVREVYASTPSQLRGRRHRSGTVGTMRARVAVRQPFAWRQPSTSSGCGRSPASRLRVRTGTSGRYGCLTAAASCASTSARSSMRRTPSRTPATWPPRWSGPGGCSMPTATRPRSTTHSPRMPRWQRWSAGRLGCGSPVMSTAARSPSVPCSDNRSPWLPRGRWPPA